MPRASLNPDKAKQGGGVESGNYEVLASKSTNIQSDFKPVQPAIILTCAPLDREGQRVRDESDVEIPLAFGEKSASRFSPGMGQSMQDNDPKDMGKEVQVEGNTIYCEEGAQFNASAGAVVFLKSLAKLGFPAEVLDTCWLPAFVGMKFFLETLPAKDINAKIGTRLNEKPSADGGTFTYKIASKWLNPEYIGKAPVVSSTASAQATNTASTVSTASTASTKPTGTATTAPTTAMSLESIVKECIVRLAKLKSGKAVPTRGSLTGFLNNEFAKGKFVGATLAQFKAALTDDEALKDALLSADVGAELTLDDVGTWTGETKFA